MAKQEAVLCLSDPRLSLRLRKLQAARQAVGILTIATVAWQVGCSPYAPRGLMFSCSDMGEKGRWLSEWVCMCVQVGCCVEKGRERYRKLILAGTPVHKRGI